MDLVERKPVNDIVISGFGKVELIGNGLARVWLVVDHVADDGKIEHRMRKRPLVIPVKALVHSILILTKAVALAVATVDETIVATLTDGDDRHEEGARR